MASMIEAGFSFLAGYACRSHCGNLPCQAKFASSGKPFKLSVVVHSATLGALEKGPGVVQNARPYISVAVQDRTKETELGDWDKVKGQWVFRETITVLTEPMDEVRLAVHCATRYDLYVAAVSVNSQRLGELCFPVAAVLNRLKAEDRDENGVVYTSPITAFDVVQDGRLTGKVYVSFETLTPPPSTKMGDMDQCCGWDQNNDFVKYRTDDEYAYNNVSVFSDVSTRASSRMSEPYPSLSRPALSRPEEPKPSTESARMVTVQYTYQ